MNIATIIFLALVVVFAWRGYAKGLLLSIAGVVGWVASYVAAILLAKPFSAWLVAHTRLDGLAVYFVAGVATFLAVSLTISLIVKLLSRLRRDTEASVA